MGFIEEIISTSNDICNKYYNTRNIFTKLYCKHNLRRLSAMIEKIKNDQISTKMISDYADYYIESLNQTSDRNSHIRHIQRSKFGNAESIAFEIPLLENNIGTVIVEFIDRYSMEGDYTFSITGPNSIGNIHYKALDMKMIEKKENVNLDIIGKTRSERLDQLNNIFIETISNDIKNVLYKYTSIPDKKELNNG